MSENETTSNPFAPTPLGKDWTPPRSENPKRDQTPVDGEAPEAVPLDDLFKARPAAAERTSETAANEEGLDDLFAGSAEAQAPGGTTRGHVPDAGTELGAAAGLDELFEARHDPSSAAVNAPAPRPRVRRRGVPAALRGKKQIVADDDADDVADHKTTSGDDAPQSVGLPVTTPGASGSDQREPLPPAVKVAATPKATAAGGPATTAPRVARASLFDRGDAEIERAWRIVDQTLAVVQSDLGLQQVTANVVLTADADEYAAQRTEIHAALRRRMAAAGIAPSGVGDMEAVLDLVVDEISGISVLGELFRDPEVDEILVDRWDVVSVERRGHLERTRVRFRDPQHAESCARVLALKVSDRAVSRAIPLVTAELPSARVTFAFGAVVKGGLSITIRKFRPLLGLDDLLRYGSLTEEMVAFLRDAVEARAGILVSGGTGTGKTTIVNLLSSFIPDTERVVSIEDAFELKLANTHVVSLQTKEASSLDDTVSVTLAELLRNTLRMRPDRIIVGEIREGAGAMVMLSAASTGHDGTLTTVHANSAEGAVNERLPDLIRQSRGGLETNTILRSIVNAFDLVLQVGRTRDGRRYVSEISAVAGVDETAGRIRLLPVFLGTETEVGIRFENRGLGSDTELARRIARRMDRRRTRKEES